MDSGHPKTKNAEKQEKSNAGETFKTALSPRRVGICRACSNSVPDAKKEKTPIPNAISIMVVYVAVYQNLVWAIASKLISLVPRNIKKGATAQWPIKTSSLLDNRPP
uniref:Uncharacterized protein n=1 Tax=Photinus pyralis TaxID=7054 RepID=A0A1Y1MPE0_PHOPY